MTAGMILFLLIGSVNDRYSHRSMTFKKRKALLSRVHTAAPATITGGRNIAFESGNAITNAPASYLTQLDCCESDEAISTRISFSQTRCTINRKNRN